LTPKAFLKDGISPNRIKEIINSQKEDVIEPETENDGFKVSIVFKLGKNPKKSILKSSIRVPISIDSVSKIDDLTTLNSFIVKDIEGKPIRNSSLSQVKFRSSRIDTRQLP
jgi:hypothetical protein